MPQQQAEGGSTEAAGAPGWPTPPTYRFDASRKPGPLYHARASDFAAPASPTTVSKGKSKANGNSDEQQDFWRRAKWSPDGSHLLAQTESHHLDLFRLVSSSSSSDADEATSAASASTSTPSKTPSYTLQHLLRISSPTPLLTYTWYPFAHPSQPASWCFAFSSRDVPVRLVDAYTGKTRATYGIEDHVERFVGPHALAFTPDGASLLCGHGSSLSIFDVTKPGTNTCATMPLVPMRRAVGAEVQRGVVAEVAVAGHHAGSEGGEQLVAVGTFAGTVGIYQRGAGAPSGRWNDSAKTPKVASSLCLAGWREEEGVGVVQVSEAAREVQQTTTTADPNPASPPDSSASTQQPPTSSSSLFASRPRSNATTYAISQLGQTSLLAPRTPRSWPSLIARAFLQTRSQLVLPQRRRHSAFSSTSTGQDDGFVREARRARSARGACRTLRCATMATRGRRSEGPLCHDVDGGRCGLVRLRLRGSSQETRWLL